MLTIELAKPVDPFANLEQLNKGYNITIEPNRITTNDRLNDETWQYILQLGILKVFNGIEKSNSVTKKDTIEIGSLYMINFGIPEGESDKTFCYIHPGIIWEQISENLYTVIPITSKYHNNVIQARICDGYIIDCDSNFKINSGNKVSFILANEAREIKRKMFMRYLGKVDNEIMDEIKLLRGEITKRTVKEKNEASLKLTKKQKMIFDEKSEKALEIANDSSLTYENRVKALLNLYNCNLYYNYLYLMFEFITRTKYESKIMIYETAEKMAEKRLPLTKNIIYQRLSETVKKRFPKIHPALLEFVCLINKLAS